MHHAVCRRTINYGFTIITTQLIGWLKDQVSQVTKEPRVLTENTLA
jgi:hypothetical protein